MGEPATVPAGQDFHRTGRFHQPLKSPQSLKIYARKHRGTPSCSPDQLQINGVAHRDLCINGTDAFGGTASVAGFGGLPGSGAHSASEAALISCLESLRVELHGSGVQVTTICPGYIATPMTETNPYRMPFILEADEFVARMARAVAAGKRFAVIPWPMAMVGSVLRVLPDWIYDRVFAKAPRKPGRT